MSMHQGMHHSAALSLCRARQSRGRAACGWSGARLMKSSRRMPISSTPEAAGAGGVPTGHLVRLLHAPMAVVVAEDPFSGHECIRDALAATRRAARGGSNEVKIGQKEGSVLTLSGHLRAWEVHVPTNVASADAMG